MATRRLACVPSPAENDREIALDATHVTAVQMVDAAGLDGARRWIAEMALRLVRAERAGGEHGDDRA